MLEHVEPDLGIGFRMDLEVFDDLARKLNAAQAACSNDVLIRDCQLVHIRIIILVIRYKCLQVLFGIAGMTDVVSQSRSGNL